MKKQAKFVEAVTALLIVALLNTGCLTGGLWRERLYHPHPQPMVQLAAAPERPLILVGYREQFENTQHIRWRAYWLDLEDRYDPYAKPNFVDPADFPGVQPIPMLTATQGVSDVPATGFAAMETLNQPGFELWQNGDSLGRFKLPTYEGTAPPTPTNVAATPLTVLVDAALIVVAAAAVVTVLYLSISNNTD